MVGAQQCRLVRRPICAAERPLPQTRVSSIHHFPISQGTCGDTRRHEGRKITTGGADDGGTVHGWVMPASQPRNLAPAPRPPPAPLEGPCRGSPRSARRHLRRGSDGPPRVELDERWDRALEHSVRSVLYSSIAGTVAAYALFRTPGTRKMVMGLGLGFGLGNAYQLSRGEVGSLVTKLANAD